MKLYEIDAEIASLLNQIDVADENGEVNEDVFVRLLELNEARNNKLENIGVYIKNLRSDVKALKEEEVNLKARRTVIENKADRIEAFLLEQMKQEEKPIESSRVRISIRHSKKVEVIDAEKVPEEYIKTKITQDVDKVEAARAFRDGKEIAGLAFVESESLQVKWYGMEM